MSQTNLADDKSKCSNPSCEYQVDGPGERCLHCGEAQLFCTACGATARLLSSFCRCCGAGLNMDWITEYPGLRYKSSLRSAMAGTATIKLNWQLSFDAEMVASPLAARGIVVISLADGRIIIVDEVDGQIRAEIGSQPPLSLTPVIADNLLVVPAGNGITAYDLIAALYGNMAKGDLIAWQIPFSSQEQVTRALLATSDMILAVVRQAARVQLVFIEKRTGKRVTGLPLEGRPAKTTAPYLKEKVLFIAAKDGTIMLIDVERAEMRAMARLGREIDTNVLPCGRASSALFVLSDGQLWSASLNSDQLQFQPFGDTGGLIINALAATDRYVAVAHGSGLVLYDPFGALMWETALDSNSLITAPLIEKDLAWVIDDSGMMFLFNLPASVPRLRQRVFEHTMALPPIFTGDKLILSSRAGQVKAYSRGQES
jgi:hypothetical protein